MDRPVADLIAACRPSYCSGVARSDTASDLSIPHSVKSQMYNETQLDVQCTSAAFLVVTILSMSREASDR